VLAGAVAIDGRKHHMRGHGSRHVAKGLEGGEVGRRQERVRLRHHRQLEVTVGGCAPVARDVLDDRQHAACHEPFGDRPGKRRHLARLAPVGAIADDAVGTGNGEIEHRVRSRC